MLKKVALIPARLASTRFPQKLLQQLGDKSVIAAVYMAVQRMHLFDDVLVATDSEAIYTEIKKYNGHAVMSSGVHESGTDRIAEAAAAMDADVIVNVQGDTPFIQREPLEKLLQQFDDATVQVASIMQVLTDAQQIENPNVVKVCVDKRNNALYFSRSLIPFRRNPAATVPYYKHVGVYAFRKKTLLDFTTWPVSLLEDAEKLEQLRYLENGVPIRMVLADFTSVEIDTPEDLERARALLNALGTSGTGQPE
jgi:3-deoxy-manno-octulosonate cytidylyltransferase (CMP-KDO synthetase)